MASREKQRGIDDQWQALQPGWGRKDYEGERKMLYDLLEPGEDVELLHSCGFEAKNVAWGSRHDRGVVVATGRRIILLNRGRLSKNRFGLTYLEIDEITEPEPGRVRLRGSGSGNATGSESGAVFDLDLQFVAADFSRFVRGHLLSDEESVAAAFSHVLALGEQVRHWAHCSAGPETVYHQPSRHNMGGGSEPEYWSTSWDGRPALAVDTERRILLITLAVDTDLLLHAREEEVIASCPTGQSWQWNARNTRKVKRSGSLTREAKYTQLTSGGRLTSCLSSILCGITRLRQGRCPGNPGLTLPGGCITRFGGTGTTTETSAINWPRFSITTNTSMACSGALTVRNCQGEKGHSGIIAATNRRLLFVSNSRDDKHVSQLPLHGIASVSRDGG